MKTMHRIATLAWMFAVCTLHGAGASAGVIYGGSTLLSPSYLTQLEAWLGEGPLALTNVYTKQPGDTASDFHAAVDGGGRTFVVMEATEANGAGPTAIIGGYDPQSWDASIGFYNITLSDAARTAFLFNLTSGLQYTQQLSSDWCPSCGQYQTFNYPGYGPTFGGGHDLYVPFNLATGGYSHLYTYAPNNADATRSLVDLSGYDGNDVMYGALEVFTIAPLAAPEPSSLALAGIAFVGAGLLRRRGRRADAAARRALI